MGNMVTEWSRIYIIFYVYWRLPPSIFVRYCQLHGVRHSPLVALTSNPLHSISVPLSPMGISSKRTIFFLTSSVNYKSDMKMWLPRQ